MEEKDLIHYKVGGNIQFAGVQMLPAMKDIESIVITHVTFHETYNVQGRVQNNVWLAHFAPGNGYTDLPFILNSTNRKRLSKQLKSNYLQTLKNFAVRLTSEKAKDMSDGGEIDSLRISKIPVKRDILNDKHMNWSKVVEYVKGGGQILGLYTKYDISDTVLKQLEACLTQNNNG